MNYRYEIRWTQKRSKKRCLLPRRVIAADRESAVRMLADALKDNVDVVRSMPKRIAITLGSKDSGPSRVEWMRV